MYAALAQTLAPQNIFKHTALNDYVIIKFIHK